MPAELVCIKRAKENHQVIAERIDTQMHGIEQGVFLQIVFGSEPLFFERSPHRLSTIQMRRIR